MFTERFRQIMTLLGASVAELAKAASCDASNISRLYSGSRVPRCGGKAATRLVRGLCLLAEQSHRTGELCTLLGCNAEVLPQRLMFWLCEDALYNRKKEPPVQKVLYPSFGERLSAVMELACLSDIRFAELLGLDAAYISRFRRGLRSPLANEGLVDAMCSRLLERLEKFDRFPQLCELAGIPAGEELPAAFREWLFHSGDPSDALRIEMLLDQIDNYMPDRQPVLTPADEALPIRERSDYIGTEGLREAVWRFVTEASRHEGAEFWLYSDQRKDWLTGDPDFFRRCTALMLKCLHKGVRIRVIHNIDSGSGDLLDTLRIWLPLFCTGMVESYYCTAERGSRFEHSLFIIPRHACIEGSKAESSDIPAIYHYHTEPEILDVYERTYDSLWKKSKPFVRFQTKISAAMLKRVDFLTAVGNTLSLTTMPESVFYAALSRSSLDADGRRDAELEWKARQAKFRRMLQSGFVHECVPPAEDTELFSGKWPLEIPGETLYYTPEEYASHVREILSISREYENYRFFSLPEPAFLHTLLVVAQDLVCVSMLRAPYMTFHILHPMLVDAFHEYSDCLKAPYLLDREAAVRKLSQYL